MSEVNIRYKTSGLCSDLTWVMGACLVTIGVFKNQLIRIAVLEKVVYR